MNVKSGNTSYINMFRGKAVEGKNWVYGDLIRGTHISNNRGAATVIPETIGMYADIIDMHGNRGFEHDILRYTALGTTVVGVICRERGCFWLAIDADRKEPLYKVATVGEIEIIGNVYDNTVGQCIREHCINCFKHKVDGAVCDQYADKSDAIRRIHEEAQNDSV